MQGRSASFQVGFSCKNKKLKRIGRGSSVISLMPKSVPSNGEEDQLFRE